MAVSFVLLFVAMLNDYDPAVFMVTPGTEVMGLTMLKLVDRRLCRSRRRPRRDPDRHHRSPCSASADSSWECVPMPDLRSTGLAKAFDDNAALHDVSIHGEDGELLTLLGPSGCGKSTTLWSIAGLHAPDQGRISVGDARRVRPRATIDLPPEARELRRGLPVVRRLAAHDRGRERRLSAQAAPIAAASGRSGSPRCSTWWSSATSRTATPTSSRGGQQQRVALARALALPAPASCCSTSPSPTSTPSFASGPAPGADLQQEIGITTVFVTHDQDEALSMSDRIVVMDAGVVRQVGTPEEIYDDPADLFVADFIGTVNLLEGHVIRQTPSHIEVAVPGVSDPLLATPVHGTTAGAAGDAVTLAIRPEAIVIEADPRQPASTPPAPTGSPPPWSTALPGRPRPVPAAGRRGHPHRPDLGADPRHRGDPGSPHRPDPRLRRSW